MNNRKKAIIVGVIVLSALSYLMLSGFSGNSIHSAEISELMQEPEKYNGKGLKVSGFVVEDSIEQGGLNLVFSVKDNIEDDIIKVEYKGVAPDGLVADSTVIMEGVFHSAGNKFVASSLMTKCPSRYEGMSYEEHEKALVKTNANI